MDEDWKKEIADLKKIGTNKITFIRFPRKIIVAKRNYIKPLAVQPEKLVVSSKKSFVKNFEPEAILDLHGYKSDQAFESLIKFIHNSYYHSVRKILIITGKSNREGGIGIIKANLEPWLNDQRIRNMIISFTEASTNYGGTGAYFVLLKKNSSK